MYARMSTFEGTTEGIDEGIADVRERVIPMCERLAGFAGLIVMVDRGTGNSVAITLWDTEDALKATEQAADEIRTDTADRNRERIVSVQRFEVGISTLKTPTGLGEHSV